jgi:hypothetical protein
MRDDFNKHKKKMKKMMTISRYPQCLPSISIPFSLLKGMKMMMMMMMTISNKKRSMKERVKIYNKRNFTKTCSQ